MSLHQILQILRARWRIAAGILALVLLATLVSSLLMPKHYLAYSSVVADIKIDPIAATAAPVQSLASYIATQVDIINSERVGRRAADIAAAAENSAARTEWKEESGGLVEFPAWLGAKLSGALVVTPSRESNVINIGVMWTSAAVAAELANAFAQAYIDVSIDLRVEPARQYASWFDMRAKELRTELEVRRKKLSDFQRDNGIVATDERLDIENARLSELSSQLLAIQAQRQESQSRQSQRGERDALPEVLQSATIADLKAQLANAEIRRGEMLARLGTNHPDYQQVESEVASLQGRIALESARIVSALGTTARVNVRREGEISEAFEAQKQRVLELRRERDAAADLQIDVLNAQRNLDAVNQRLAQSTLESLTQQTNVLPLTRASAPGYPSSPRIKLNLAIAFFFGLILGVGVAVVVELRDRRIRGGIDLAEVVGSPLLGILGSIDRSRGASARLAAETPALAARRLEPTVAT